jgi:3-hydroxyisobutyrate dehydrogenase
MKVGLIGVGNMGRAIAERLLETGHIPCLWNRTRSKAEAVEGAQVFDTPVDVVSVADVIISILANDDAIGTAYDGVGGLCSTDLTGKTIIEMCTTSSETACALDAKVAAKGGQFLECPVGGTIGPAKTGQLLGLAAGTDAAFTAAEPVMRDLTRRLEHLGPVGRGAAMKLAINLPLMVYWGAVGEAIALAVGNGIDPALATDILVDSSGAIGAAKKRVPPIHEFLTTGNPGATSLNLQNGIKDMKLMEAALSLVGAPSPVVSAARARAEDAAAGGWSDLDTSLFGVFGQTEVKP